MFTNCYNTGVQFTFANGLSISIQWGGGNYCDNRNLTPNFDEQKLSRTIVECPNAEIAIWDENNNWYNFGSDTVKGWVTTDEVAQWMTKVQTAKNINEI
jgi:hypothetical protein